MVYPLRVEYRFKIGCAKIYVEYSYIVQDVAFMEELVLNHNGSQGIHEVTLVGDNVICVARELDALSPLTRSFNGDSPLPLMNGRPSSFDLQ